jgi:hypothetical protein
MDDGDVLPYALCGNTPSCGLIFKQRTRSRQPKSSLRFPDLWNMQKTTMKLYVQYGMKRSGNHAVSSILQPALSTLHLNNIVPMGPIYAGDTHMPSLDRAIEFLRPQAPAKYSWLGLKASLKTKTAYLSLEDIPMSASHFARDRPTRILVMRSFENMMSSRIRKGFREFHPAYPTEWNDTMKQIVDTWKQHARIYLSTRDQWQQETRVAILFDEWVKSSSYRQFVYQKLGIAIKDEELDKVSSFGGGSSFDGVDLDGQAQNMKVLSRSEQLNDAELNLLSATMNDTELKDLIDQMQATEPAHHV